MICASCRESYPSLEEYLAHKPHCAGQVVWDEHWEAMKAGKHRKAARLARKALHVETPPMPAALLEKFKDPDRQREAQVAAKLKHEALRRMRQELAAAGRRRRRILT